MRRSSSTDFCAKEAPAAATVDPPPVEGPLAMVADALRSPGFLFHAITDSPDGGTPTAPELAARVALVVAGSAVVDKVAANASAREESESNGKDERCTPRRARASSSQRQEREVSRR